MPPESPSRSVGSDPPLVLNPLNSTVTRFTHDGMPVKSTEVPEADTAAPDTKPPITGVPVTLGETIPVVPFSVIGIFFPCYRMTQRLSSGTVTVMLSLIVMGPVLMALIPVGMV